VSGCRRAERPIGSGQPIRVQRDLSLGRLLWQGHLLDLLGRRNEAIARYQRILARQYGGQWVHDQYELRYSLMTEATTRITLRFRRIENRER